MKKVENLKKGDKIYDVHYFQVKWYSYLCVHPNAKNYSILIDMNEEPIRIYNAELQMKLDKNLTSYDEARLHLANKLEEKAKSLRGK